MKKIRFGDMLEFYQKHYAGEEPVNEELLRPILDWMVYCIREDSTPETITVVLKPPEESE